MSRLVACAAVALLLAPPALASSQTLGPPISTWEPNGTVGAVALDGHTLYVGGEFDIVGPATGSFGVVSATDATAMNTGAAVKDSTSAIAADGAGGWFVATSPLFGPTVSVLHVRADGARDPAWTPPLLDQGVVVSLVVDGGRLFVGGAFRTVNGTARPGLAALDPVSGALLAWDARLIGMTLPAASIPAAVFTMAAAPGRLYVSGFIESAGGAARARFAVIDTATGDALPGTLPAEVFVDKITATASRVYIYGFCRPTSFAVCAYSPDMTPLPGWTFPAAVGPMVAGPAALYTVEGSLVGPPFGLKLVARDFDTGTALPFATPEILGTVGTTVSGLSVAGNTVYVAGDFATIGGERRWRVAAIDATTGTLLPWAPLVGGPVRAVATAGGAVAFGGTFRVASGVAKQNLVAIDLRTGRPGAATPNLTFNVKALLQLGGVVVAGGARSFGVTGPDVTAFTAATGALLPWALQSNGEIEALATDRRRLYIGGRFSSLSGTLRLNLAAVDLGAATLTSWNPQPDGPITTLAVDGATLFAGGAFNTLPGFGRLLTAAFDTTSGQVLSFNASAQPRLVPNGFGFAPGRVLAAGEDFSQPYGAAALTWLDRISGEPVAPLGVSFRTGATAQRDGTLFLAGATSSGMNALLGIETATGRFRTWGLGIESSAGIPTTVAVNADYVAAGSGTTPLTMLQNLVVYPAPRAAAPQQMQSAVAGSAVTLAWQPGAGATATAYLVEAGTIAGGTDVGVFNVGLATRVSGALAPGTYFLRVRGLGANGPGGASSEVIATVPSTSTPPAAPGTLAASVSGSVVTLTWGAAAGNATSYVIEAGTATGLTNIGALPTGNLDTTWSAPVPRGTYVVRVRAANTFGLSATTNEVTVVVP